MQHRIAWKIKKIRYYLSLLDEYKKDCKQRFIEDPMFEGALLHYLYKTSDSCIALAEMVIKYKNLGSSESYYGAIDTLGEQKILPRAFAYDFAKIASFRNFLAHDYEEVDYLFICEEVLSKLDEIREYLHYIDSTISKE